METNAVNTQLTPEFLESLSKEERTDLLEYLTNYPFIRWMIDPNRPYAKDLERDSDGKIIVNVVKPHILENMNYFRKPALAYKKYGKYTNLRPNGNPNSPYMKWLRKEVLKCWYGCKRPSDGEWITGYHYFYLNYSPIERATTNIKDTNAVNRVVDFPDFYDGDYIFFHYINQARYGGMYNEYKGGNHSALIAARGKGKSFKVASMTTRNFVLGENIDVSEKVKSVIVASNTEYLKKDGTLNKVMAMTDFLALNTQFPSSRLKSSTQEMHWVMGYKDTKNKDVSLGTRNEVIGLSLNNDSDKARGKRSHLMVWEEFGMFPGFIDAWNTSRPNVEEGGYSFGQAIALGTGGCVCAGTKIYTNSGEIKNIEDLIKEEGIIGYNTETKTYSKETISYIQPLQKKECLEITTSFGKTLRCSKDHPILVKDKFIEAKDLKLGDKVKIVKEIPLFGNYSPKYPRVIGWLLGDGSYGRDQVARLFNCEPEILDFIKSNFKCTVQREHVTKLGKLYQEVAILGFCKFLREEGIYGQTKLRKTFPTKIGQYSKEALSELIGGFFDTDGYVYCRKAKELDLAEISASSASKQLLEMLSLLLIKFGIHGRIRERKPRENNPLDKNSYYEYTIADSVSLLNFCNFIKLYPKVKQEKLNKIKEIFSKKIPTSKREEKIISIENIGLQTIYNLTADNTHTYIANGIVTHNTEGSDFSGALEMIYNPLGYNVYGVPNVFDKGTSGGSKSILFIGEYMNRKGCYDKDGNSDIVKAVLEEVKERVFIKYNSTDPATIAQRIAEHPMSIQEAVMRRDGTLFPVADLTDHLNYIESNKIEWNRGHLVGELYQDPNGIVQFRPTDEEPIRDFPLKDNRHKGALEIYELPKEVNGKVPSYRYIGGIDPVDDDHSTTVSLPSIFILDMFTDRIVAEYTGRPNFADDFYEICRKLALFYNASLNYENDKKGLFTYFSNHHCTYMLCDTPDILRDTELVKTSLWGNKSKGCQSSKQVNAYARRLIRDWLLQPVKTKKLEIDENGNEIEKEVTIKNLQRIRGTALLKELITWNPDINADRVSALGMLMILRENNMKYLPGEGHFEGKRPRHNYLGNDPFFSKNYNI